MLLNILINIAETDSSKTKEAIIKQNEKNELLKTVFRLAYSKQIMFGIKKFPIREEGKVSLTLSDALKLLEDNFATRLVTGNAAAETLKQMVDSLTAQDAEVIRRVIARDLDIGAGKTIANKVWKKLIPEQPQMLATAYSEKALEKIVYPAYAQLKADGARCFAEITGDTLDDVRLVSRNGNEYIGLNKLKQQLIDITRNLRTRYPEGVMIDGELVWFAVKAQCKGTLLDLFDDVKVEVDPEVEQTVQSRTDSNGIANKSLQGTITQLEADGMKFQVWDFVPLSCAYSKGEKDKILYGERFQILKMIVQNADALILIENHVVNNIDEARAIYKEYVLQGLEGIILKNIESYWEDKRSKNLVKFKEEIDIDLEVVDTYVHRKDPNKLGGVYLRSKCGRIRVKCGSGFTDTTHEKLVNKKTKTYSWELIPIDKRGDKDREYLWSIRDEIPGWIAECKSNGWVTSEGRKDGTVGLFLPIFKIWRRDKSVANTFEEAFGVDFTEATGIK